MYIEKDVADRTISKYEKLIEGNLKLNVFEFFFFFFLCQYIQVLFLLNFFNLIF